MIKKELKFDEPTVLFAHQINSQNSHLSFTRRVVYVVKKKKEEERVLYINQRGHLHLHLQTTLTSGRQNAHIIYLINLIKKTALKWNLLRKIKIEKNEIKK